MARVFWPHHPQYAKNSSRYRYQTVRLSGDRSRRPRPHRGGKRACERNGPPPPEAWRSWTANSPGERWIEENGRVVPDPNDSIAGYQDVQYQIIVPNHWSVEKRSQEEESLEMEAFGGEIYYDYDMLDIDDEYYALADDVAVSAQIRLEAGYIPAVNLLSLPNEILTIILTNIVLTGSVYHSSISDDGYYSVHWLADNMNDPSKGVTPMAIALTCRTLRDLVYPLFYSKNQFILELSTEALTSYVDISCPDLWEDKEDGDKYWSNFESLNRLYRSESTDGPHQWPLRDTAFRYMNSLTLVVWLSTAPLVKSEQSMLLQQTEMIIGDLVKASNADLRLHVGVGYVDKIYCFDKEYGGGSIWYYDYNGEIRCLSRALELSRNEKSGLEIGLLDTYTALETDQLLVEASAEILSHAQADMAIKLAEICCPIKDSRIHVLVKSSLNE